MRDSLRLVKHCRLFLLLSRWKARARSARRMQIARGFQESRVFAENTACPLESKVKDSFGAFPFEDRLWPITGGGQLGGGSPREKTELYLDDRNKRGMLASVYNAGGWGKVVLGASWIMGTLLWVSVAATGAHNYSYPSTIACCAYMCLMYYWIMRGYVCRGMFGLAIDY